MAIMQEITIQDLHLKALILGRSRLQRENKRLYFLHIALDNDEIIKVLVPREIKQNIFDAMKQGKQYRFHLRQYASTNKKRYKLVGTSCVAKVGIPFKVEV